MKRMKRVLLSAAAGGALVLGASAPALADDDSQAMAAHMAAWDRGVPGHVDMMDGSSRACENMMENAPPFGAEGPHDGP